MTIVNFVTTNPTIKYITVFLTVTNIIAHFLLKQLMPIFWIFIVAGVMLLLSRNITIVLGTALISVNFAYAYYGKFEGLTTLFKLKKQCKCQSKNKKNN